MTAILAPLSGDAAAKALDCAELTSNAEMTDCMKRRYESADQELNRVYQMAIDKIRKSDHLTVKQRKEWEAAFRKAQRAWVTFKDADCGEMIGWEWHGGSGMALTSLTCLFERTATRTEEIRSRYISEAE